MAIPTQSCPLGETHHHHPAWASLHPVGLGVAGSVLHAAFLDWAGNLATQPRVPTIRRGVITTPAASARARRQRRRVPEHARRLFTWGFIATNAAVTAAWARAAGGEAIPVAAAVSRAAAAVSYYPPLLARWCGGPLMRFMVGNMALMRGNVAGRRWWTLLTCAVSHAEPGHLLANMGEFYVWVSRCFDLGVGVGGVAGLMVGSGLCCGLACVLGGEAAAGAAGARGPGVYLGASGVVCGLQAAAILLEPVMRFRVPDLGDVCYPLFLTLLTGCTGDLKGLLFQRLEPAPSDPWLAGGVPQQRIGYAGHVAGTAFGVAYWYFWLRPRFGTW